MKHRGNQRVHFASVFGMVCLMACSEAGLNRSEHYGDTGFSATTTSSATGTSSWDGGTESKMPSYWDLQGALALDGSNIAPDASTLTITLHGDEPALEILCRDTSAFLINEAAKATPPKWMHQWWNVAWTSEKCSGVPSSFGLGIGPYDPQLDPAIAAKGIDNEALEGAYLRITDDGPLYIFGIARSSKLVSDSPKDTGDTGVPIPTRRTYTIQGLQLLAL